MLAFNVFYIFSLQDEFMNFIIMFMASPEYIRNPYLRAKMVEVLNCLMPRGRCLMPPSILKPLILKITIRYL